MRDVSDPDCDPSSPGRQQSFRRAASDEWALNWEMTLTRA